MKRYWSAELARVAFDRGEWERAAMGRALHAAIMATAGYDYSSDPPILVLTETGSTSAPLSAVNFTRESPNAS